MEEKLEKFDEKINKEVSKLISSLGFEIHDNMSLEEEMALSREMGVRGYAIDIKGDTSEGKYVVTVNLIRTFELIL
ncbi:hypothetical protein [Bacillus paranthracis]|uniref:hypothetical protein n=1 Tax=Bacillus paranthracis TaxID=2026186 RepID=UPI0013D4B4F2|nr:hypothetical protein [Bacillus paranthracis]